MSSGAPQSTPRVLFRYRDLIDQTVERHREIIEKEGSCWWGWWKRPTEQRRDDVWDYLAGQISTNGFVKVALFDSGAANDLGAIRLATVTELIPPTSDASSSPDVPAADAALVPEYYRKSPFSRAWLKMKEIGDPIVSFFGSFSYDVPPPLPHIPQQYLDRLSGKIILDGFELRAMDVTIWRIRPKAAGDLDERFLAPSIRILKPSSSDPVAVPGSAILHLTDLHFADPPHDQHRWDTVPAGPNGTLAEKLCQAIRATGLTIGVVIVTGDFTFLASPTEFEAAAKSINLLLGTLGLGPDNVVLIPGNHDIAWTSHAAGYDPLKPVEFAPDAAKQNYRAFYVNLLRHPPNPDLSMGRRFILPGGLAVDVCALNSSSLEQGPNYLAGMGRVTPAAFGRIRAELQWTDSRALALRILAIHHHITATEDLENPAEYAKGFGMAVDAKKVLRDAARYGVHLIMHGNRHRPFVWYEGVFALPEFTEPATWSLGRVALVGGGSAGSKSVDGNRNFFNLFVVKPDVVELQMFRSENAADFTRMNRWHAKLALVDGRLQLEEWTECPPEGNIGH